MKQGINSGDVSSPSGGWYEDGDNNNSGWAEGHSNGDGDSHSSDFSFAFVEGGYAGRTAGAEPLPRTGGHRPHQPPLDLVTAAEQPLPLSTRNGPLDRQGTDRVRGRGRESVSVCGKWGDVCHRS